MFVVFESSNLSADSLSSVIFQNSRNSIFNSIFSLLSVVLYSSKIASKSYCRKENVLLQRYLLLGVNSITNVLDTASQPLQSTASSHNHNLSGGFRPAPGSVVISS
jgi:hypothetical protein